MTRYKGAAQIENVLVASANDRHMQVDRKMLTLLRYSRVTSVARADDGLRLIERRRPDLLIVGSTLADMDGVDFVREIRERFPEESIPSMMVTLRNQRNDVLEAISAGCAGYVLRPYSQETFNSHLQVALETAHYEQRDAEKLEKARVMAEEGLFDSAITHYGELLTEIQKAERLFTMGMEALVEGRLGRAITAFNRALAYHSLFAEAYKGLADAYRAKGDSDKCEANLKMAADILVQQERHNEVKSIFVEILQLDPHAMNPYNSLGMRLRQKGDHESALKAYFQAQKISPDDEHLCFNIAKAYVHLGEARNARRYVEEALEINPQFTHAVSLYERITGVAWAG